MAEGKLYRRVGLVWSSSLIIGTNGVPDWITCREIARTVSHLVNNRQTLRPA